MVIGPVKRIVRRAGRIHKSKYNTEVSTEFPTASLLEWAVRKLMKFGRSQTIPKRNVVRIASPHLPFSEARALAISSLFSLDPLGVVTGLWKLGHMRVSLRGVFLGFSWLLL